LGKIAIVRSVSKNSHAAISATSARWHAAQRGSRPKLSCIGGTDDQESRRGCPHIATSAKSCDGRVHRTKRVLPSGRPPSTRAVKDRAAANMPSPWQQDVDHHPRSETDVMTVLAPPPIGYEQFLQACPCSSLKSHRRRRRQPLPRPTAYRGEDRARSAIAGMKEYENAALTISRVENRETCARPDSRGPGFKQLIGDVREAPASRGCAGYWRGAGVRFEDRPAIRPATASQFRHSIFRLPARVEPSLFMMAAELIGAACTYFPCRAERCRTVSVPTLKRHGPSNCCAARRRLAGRRQCAADPWRNGLRGRSIRSAACWPMPASLNIFEGAGER